MVLSRVQADLEPDRIARRGRRRLSVDHLLLTPTRPLPGQTMQDAVYQQLRNAFMVGAFRPGEAVSARSLAATFGTSGMPVKDALRRLVAIGVLNAMPQSAYVVETLTAASYMDLVEARVRLETLMIGRTTRNAGSGIAAELRGLNLQYRAAWSPGSIRGDLLKRNFDFHFTIYAAAAMPDVCELVLGIWLRIGSLFSLIEADLDREEDFGRHSRIVDAIEKRDAEAAAAALERDIRATAERIVVKLPH